MGHWRQNFLILAENKPKIFHSGKWTEFWQNSVNKFHKGRHHFEASTYIFIPFIVFYHCSPELAEIRLKLTFHSQNAKCDPANFKLLKIFSVSWQNLDFVASSLLVKKSLKNMAKLGWKRFTFSAEKNAWKIDGFRAESILISALKALIFSIGN